MASPDCYEAIAGLDEALSPVIPEGHNYFVLGGIVTGAMIHPDTHIEYASKAVFAAPGSGESIVRDNGTVRNIKILIDKILADDEVEDLKDIIAKNTGGLEVSVFGFAEHQDRETVINRVAKSAGKWISERTIDAEGVKRIELHPFSRVLPDAVFEPWSLVMPSGARVNQFNLAGHALAYRTRYISGVRYKDKKKVEEMDRVINRNKDLLDDMHALPSSSDDIQPGPFLPLRLFAEDLWIARIARIKPDQFDEINTTRAELAAFRWKGQLLQKLESDERLIKFAQTPIGAKVLSPFTHTS